MPGSGHKHLLNFHMHGNAHQHHHLQIPKGCVSIMVGQGDEQKRFVIPVMYINHPLFLHLLKEAEEEYGFDHKGPINLPCHVVEFCYVRGIIDKETSQHHHNHNHHHHHHHHHHHQNFLCFKA